MGARPVHFALTPKGVEELALRTHRLDTRLRNILFLIQKGTPTVEAILQNSIFPHEEVIEKLRGLLKERFVEHVSGTRAAEASPFVQSTAPVFPILDRGVSMSQARFVLCDFCLDQFGTKAQPLLDAIEAAADVAELQRVLDAITTEVRRHCKDKLPVLTAKVREVNESLL